MSARRRRRRLALSFMFSVVVFLVLLVAILVAALTVFVLAKLGLMDQLGGRNLSVYHAIVFMAFISVVVGTLAALCAGSVSLRPVDRLLSGMQSLAGGNFKVRLSYGRPFGRLGPVKEITDSFNTLAEELESTEMLRGDFINNFSHEFKTPIVSIAGFAKLLQRGKLTEEQKLEYLGIIEEESLRLASMATNVLDLTRVENQKILTDLTRYNLSEQLRSCVLLLERRWEEKRLGFKLEFGEYFIEANEELLKQVFINLIDNAIKFSPPGQQIEIDIEEKGDSLAVTVQNRGPDIEPREQKRIFQKFYQAEESHSTRGNGLGLAIAKRIVDLHSGSIVVESGGGVTSFTVALPKTQSHRLGI